MLDQVSIHLFKLSSSIDAKFQDIITTIWFSKIYIRRRLLVKRKELLMDARECSYILHDSLGSAGILVAHCSIGREAPSLSSCNLNSSPAPLRTTNDWICVYSLIGSSIRRFQHTVIFVLDLSWYQWVYTHGIGTCSSLIIVIYLANAFCLICHSIGL